jgi:hypothetical protein
LPVGRQEEGRDKAAIYIDCRELGWRGFGARNCLVTL